MDSDTDSDSDYESYNSSRPDSSSTISRASSSGVEESAGILITRGRGSQFTTQSTQSPSSNSEEEGGSEQSDSNPDSPEYHSTGKPFQQYSYSAFTGSGRGLYGRSGSSSESDENQSQEVFLSEQVDKKALKRNKPPDSSEGSSSSSVEDSDKHVDKKPHIETKADHEYSDFAKKMMTKMGHEPGTGLGRSGEGIVEPIKESTQRGRAGLGTEGVPELEPEDVVWEEEEVNCEESPEWIVPCSSDPPTVDDEGLDTWFKIGKRKTTIEDETLFCDEEVLKQILKNKTVFDSFDRKAFLDARDRSNPFELIKGIIFQNRAAMKMANMDAIFDFMFTGMRDKSGKKITETNELLYFADICAGPGGFTEYVLYRTKWHAKGFGFTLKVCHGFRNTSRSVAEYLFDVNDKLNELKNTEEDVIEVVPLHILQQEEEFMSYVTKSNDQIGEQQSTGLEKIQFYVKNRNLLERRQADIKRKCLKLWKFDDEIRKARSIPEHKVIFNEVWKKLTKSLEANEANFKPNILTADDLPPDVYTWKWYYWCGERYVIVGAGRSKFKGWTQKGPLGFGLVINTVNVELPPQTVLDVDVCEDFNSRGTKHFIIEVVDALSISGEFIGYRPFPERQALIHKLCKAVNKPGRTQLRLKKCHRFVDIEKMLSKLKDISERKVPNIVSDNEDGSQTRPKGVVLFKTLKNPWHLQFSKSSQKLYFYNDMAQRSVYEAPPDSVATYQDQLQSRMLWLWQPFSCIRTILELPEDTNTLQKGLLTKSEVTEHVAKRLHM